MNLDTERRFLLLTGDRLGLFPLRGGIGDLLFLLFLLAERDRLLERLLLDLDLERLLRG